MLRRIDQNKELKTIYSIFVKGKKGLPFRKNVIFWQRSRIQNESVYSFYCYCD